MQVPKLWGAGCPVNTTVYYCFALKHRIVNGHHGIMDIARKRDEPSYYELPSRRPFPLNFLPYDLGTNYTEYTLTVMGLNLRLQFLIGSHCLRPPRIHTEV